MVIWGFAGLILSSNIHPIYDKQLKELIAKKGRQIVNKYKKKKKKRSDECFKSRTVCYGNREGGSSSLMVRKAV